MVKSFCISMMMRAFFSHGPYRFPMTAGKKSCNAPQCGQVPRNFENCGNFRHHCQICAAPVNFHFLLQCRTICPIWAQCRQLGAIGTTGLRFAAMPAMRPQCPQCAAMALSRLSGAAGSCHAPAMPLGRAAMQPLCGEPRWNARRPGPRPARPAMHAQCSAMGASRAHCSPPHNNWHYEAVLGAIHLQCERSGAQCAQGAQWAQWAGNVCCVPAIAQCARNSCNATEPGTVPTMGVILLKSVKWPPTSANQPEIQLDGQF